MITKGTRPFRTLSLFEFVETRAVTRLSNHSCTQWRASCSTLVNRLRITSALRDHYGCVNTLGWNAEGSMLVSGSDDCRICVWRCIDESRLALQVAVPTGHRRNIFCARFAPGNHEQVVTGARDGDVRLTHISTGHNHRLSRSEQFVSKLEFLPMSSSVFIATGQAGLVRMYDLRERSRTSVIVDLSSIGGSTTPSLPQACGA